MARCAVVDLETNIVKNIIVADPTDLAPDNCRLVEIKNIPVVLPEGINIDPNHPLIVDGIPEPAHIGWKWTGSEFVEI